MHPFLNIAIDTARQAGDYIARMYDQMDRVTITEKSTNDYVTSVDQKSEQIIINGIQEKYPRHSILAEESSFNNLNDNDSENNASEIRWIIDPLDGTFNFINGFPYFSVSIAVEVKGIIEHAVVYNPLSQELFTATKGAGSRLNGRRIRMNNQKGLDKALIGTGFPAKNKIPNYLKIFEKVLNKYVDIRSCGSAALDLAFVAAGRLGGFWEADLAIWDIAAGVLLIEEAGGFVSDFKGDKEFLKSGNVVSGSEKIHKELLEILSE